MYHILLLPSPAVAAVAIYRPGVVWLSTNTATAATTS